MRWRVKILSFDQSIAAFGWCEILESGDDGKMGTLKPVKKTADTLARMIELSDKALAMVDETQPKIVTMEGYAYAQHSRSDAILKELGGVLKCGLYRRGYRDEGEKVLRIQTQSTMKKFNLSNGAVKKDGEYLATVLHHTGIKFADDNQADAYMHAQLAYQVDMVANGCGKISGFPLPQQEALMSNGFSERKKEFKGITLARAVKTFSEEQKRELVL